MRLTKGAYVDRTVWDALTAYQRYRTRVLACARLEPDTMFSHDSAAALWGLPLLNGVPLLIHARTPRTSGGRSGVMLRRHALGLDPRPFVIDGAAVTSLAVTLADAAGNRDLAAAVCVVDAGLARSDAPSKAEVMDAALGLGDPRRAARTRRAIEFSDPRATSPGESYSRVQIHALGFPPPDLQVEIHDRHGLAGIVDFAWLKVGVVGEFDGKVKYGKQRLYQRGMSPEDILVQEKRREDRIRRVVPGFARWDWGDARTRATLAGILEDAGLHR